ncbi:hypothetical protein BV22DRAFT_987111, partial [Leucogyrophana mollusca]
KKQRQWARWSDYVLPSLVRPYLKLLKNTSSFRNPPTPMSQPCTCGQSGQKLDIVCVHMESLESITLRSCECNPAANQLLSRGLCPCAPIAPTLAVSISMLEFVRECFLRLLPNMTGWCDSVKSFLASRSYKLKTRDTLRKRFSNALHWY